jgi:hypothetical protein
LKNSIFQSTINNHIFAMIITCVIPMAAFAGLSYLGVFGSWGFYVVFLLCPLAYILMMEKMHPTPQIIIEHRNPSKGRTGK